MFRESEQLPAELKGRVLELETLEPDGNGNFRIESGDADTAAGSEPTALKFSDLCPLAGGLTGLP